MDINWMINHKKSVNKRIKDAKKRIKPVKCPLCGRPLGKTCNSHSVPRMILETISKDGYLYNKNKVDNLEFFEQKSGINKTGTFFIYVTVVITVFSWIMKNQRLYMSHLMIKCWWRLQ